MPLTESPVQHCPNTPVMLYCNGKHLNNNQDQLFFEMANFSADTLYSLCVIIYRYDSSIVKIAEFPALKSLWIQNCQVTDEGLAKLKKLQSLKTLKTNNCPITGDGLTVLREFPSLTELGLSNLYLGNAGLSGLTELTSLETCTTAIARLPHSSSSPRLW